MSGERQMTSQEFRLLNRVRWLCLNAKSRADHLDRIVPRLSPGDPLDLTTWADLKGAA